MTDAKETAWLIERIIHKYVQYEKKPQLYGNDLLLTGTEINTIAIIGDYPGINITTLAKLRGITKGAASQMVYRLVYKGLIEKSVSPASDAAVSLSLTKEGAKVLTEHKKKYAAGTKTFAAILKTLPDETGREILDFLHNFDEELTK